MFCVCLSAPASCACGATWQGVRSLRSTIKCSCQASQVRCARNLRCLCLRCCSSHLGAPVPPVDVGTATSGQRACSSEPARARVAWARNRLALAPARTGRHPSHVVQDTTTLAQAPRARTGSVARARASPATAPLASSPLCATPRTPTCRFLTEAILSAQRARLHPYSQSARRPTAALGVAQSALHTTSAPRRASSA